MPTSKRVLLFSVDLFDGRNSGAQRVYEQIIENNPDLEFEFFVRLSSLRSLNPPPNAVVIKISDSNPVDFDSLVSLISNRTFYCIDVPDWLWSNSGIRNQLRDCNVKFEKLIVAAHGDAGQIRKHAYLGNQNQSEARYISSRQKEIYRTADCLYGLNPIDPAWVELDKKFIAINPVDMIEASFWSHAAELNQATHDYVHDSKLNKLIFFGRQDGHKGIHFVLDLMANEATKGLVLELVGPESFDPKEADLVTLRKNILRHRITFDRSLRRSKLFHKLVEPDSLVVIPSPYESFCIAALELFFLNTRVIVDSRIPALNFIRRTFETPNFYEFDTGSQSSVAVATIHRASASEIVKQTNILDLKHKLENTPGYVRISEFERNLKW
jgi:hypothetical protein